MFRKSLVGTVALLGALLAFNPAHAQETEYEIDEEIDTPAGEAEFEGEAEVEEEDMDADIEPIREDQPQVGFAEEDEDEMMVSPQGRQLTDFGLGVSVGGAVIGFTDSEVRNFTNTGGGWEGRLTFGTRSPLAAEAAYIGTANRLDAVGLDEDATLLSNGVEGAARLNLLTQAIQPYLLAGAAWKHYEIVNTDVNTSSLANDDDVLEIPLGAGIAYHYQNFTVDARGNFRPAVAGSDMVTNDDLMHTWSATLRLGANF